MPTLVVGHSTALPNLTPGPQIGQQDPRTSPQSRRQASPPVAGRARSSRSSRPHNARQPTRGRQIPIDRASPTAEPKPPAVSSPEACRTPAGRGQAPHPSVSGRCPTTLNTYGLSGGASDRSAVRGQADEIRQKADVRALTSGAEGKADHLAGTSGRGVVAEAVL
jgi:hypothetical protein